MAEVVLENVSKTYPGGVQAVKGISLRFHDGELAVLLGPSGCGKSTILRMVAGLEDITAGMVRIGGRVVNRLPPRDRNVAMVFQNYALYPHMTVYHNLAFPLKLGRLSRHEIDLRVREAAEILGLVELLDRKPHSLSGGQRQRAAVGRAIVRRPSVFLFDEPLSNLDAKGRAEMRVELKRLHRRLAVTTVYVTHDQEEAMMLGDRIAVIRDGLLQQCGRPQEIYDRPANRFVAGFVGTPAMNFLNGQVVLQDGKLLFDEGAARLDMLPEQARKLARWVGREIVLGIRPEALHVAAEGRFAGKGNTLPVQVGLIEPLGEKIDVYAETPIHHKIVARVDAHQSLRPGQTTELYVDMRRVCFLEPGDTGACL